jgi:hypothetical protein
VEHTRKEYVEQGLEYALQERPRPGVKPKLGDKQEAYLIARSCRTPPENQVKWTMQLLADRLGALGIVNEISDETVRRTLKKTRSNPGTNSNGAFPVEAARLCGAWKMSWISLSVRPI